MDKNFLRNNDLGLLLLRLTVGGLMLFHGVHKLIYGVSAIEGMLVGIGLPASSPTSLWLLSCWPQCLSCWVPGRAWLPW